MATLGELKPLEEFSNTMTDTGLLDDLTIKKRQALLHDLYGEAETTKKLERLAERLRARIPDYGDLRKRAENASRLLRQALSNIRDAVEVGESLLVVTVCRAGEPRVVSAQENFQGVEDTLEFFIEDLDHFRQSATVWIAQGMRPRAGKKLVEQVGYDKDDPYLAVPLSEQTASFGHWFIHQAHALLWKYRHTNNHEIPIIKELFKAAFGMTVEYDYVRYTLKRQKEKGEGRKLAAQMKIAISLAKHHFDGGPITVKLKPPQRTTSHALSGKALE